MYLDKKFYDSVQKLKAPRAGTELMGPLLYSLIRSIRPQKVLEVGIGYSTPFILKALEDNASDFERELEQLRSKNRKYLENIAGENTDGMQIGSRARQLMHEWIAEEPPLVAPEYYKNSYEPQLYAIDNLSSENINAALVQQVIKEIKSDRYLHLINDDFRNCISLFRGNFFDLVWFDCGGSEDYKDFIETYWDFINVNGGILLLHSTLNGYNFHCVLNFFKMKTNSKYDNAEVLSLLEPHKLVQGSVTMIKKIIPQIPKFTSENAVTLLKHIREVI